MLITVKPAVRFGWSAKNPPDYLMPVTEKDILNPRTLEPTDAFVRRIGQKLMGDADDCPRFVVLPNLLGQLKTPKKVRQFQWAVTHKVFETFRKPLTEHLKTTEPLAIAAIYRPDSTPHSQLHYDGDEKLPLMSLSYGPNGSLEGGKPVLADQRQCLRDQALDPEDPAFVEKLRGLTHQHYRLTLNPLDLGKDMAVVLINNIPGRGVQHAASPYTQADHDKLPAKRPLGILRFFLSNMGGKDSVSLSRLKPALKRFFNGDYPLT